ncbi:MAG: metal-sensitive transcriptional regulator [Actinomycetes bacterium]|jgi:DNA-binding FrmR family transcriptional regulator
MAKITAKKSLSHVLEDQESKAAILKRLKRANGQLAAVIRMLEEDRPCNDIVTQMGAASKAINIAALNLISASMQECVVEGKTNGAEVKAQLEKLLLIFA